MLHHRTLETIALNVIVFHIQYYNRLKIHSVCYLTLTNISESVLFLNLCFAKSLVYALCWFISIIGDKEEKIQSKRLLPMKCTILKKEKSNSH